MRRARSVEDYIANASNWHDELIRLRRVLINAQEGKTRATTRILGAHLVGQAR